MARAAKDPTRLVAQSLSPIGGPALLLACSLLLVGCSCNEEVAGPDAGDRDPVTGLTPLEAKEVLVTVGDRSITLGDYVATLLRMDRFERLRYQTEERQKELLDEMIEVELLAQEAKRRGLDKDPEVELRIQQALRDELLRLIEAELPAPEEFTERQVREYYDAHRSEFKEPERRRVLLLQVGSREIGEKVLEQVRGGSGQKWGELAKKYSLDRQSLSAEGAPELAGDVGFVSAPGEERGQNDAVPESARKAVFELEKVGDVVDRLIPDDKFFLLVRLGGISPARDRTVAEADRTIRVELRRQKFLEAEKELEADLRKKYPVIIDDKAIANYRPPSAPPVAPVDEHPQKPAPAPAPSPPPPPPPPQSASPVATPPSAAP